MYNSIHVQQYTCTTVYMYNSIHVQQYTNHSEFSEDLQVILSDKTALYLSNVDYNIVYTVVCSIGNCII